MAAIKLFGRKTLLYVGHIGFAVVHAFVGYCSIIQYTNGVAIGVFAFSFIYMNTSGPIAWVYSAETCSDTGLGISLACLWVTVLILSLVCPYLMEKDVLGPAKVFFMFSFCSCVALIFIFYCIEETKGLSDSDKK